jgi:hypothetical protein
VYTLSVKSGFYDGIIPKKIFEMVRTENTNESKVPAMQNFGTFYFSFKHTLLDPFFSVIRQNSSREKCKILRGYRNLQNSLIL